MLTGRPQGAPPRVVFVVTEASEQVRVFLAGQLGFIGQHGFDVTVISSPGPELVETAERENARAIAVEMTREIAPLGDLRALLRLVRHLRRLQPVAVVSGSPKAGFLGTLAAFLAGVPTRIYHVRTLRLETVKGPKFALLWMTEWIAGHAATRVVAISRSLAQRVIELKTCAPRRVTVVGAGSSMGVDTARFARTKSSLKSASAAREALGLPREARVIGFVGRFTRDKGIPELLDAFDRCRDAVPGAVLLLVGRFEDGDPVSSGTRERIERDPDIYVVSWCHDPAPYYLLMDLLVLPSFREGFGNVILEANSCEIPVVAFATGGIVDAVVDGQTGTLVRTGDVPALAAAVIAYLRDEDLRRDHGARGRRRAEKSFRPIDVWTGMLDEIRRGIGHPQGFASTGAHAGISPVEE